MSGGEIIIAPAVMPTVATAAGGGVSLMPVLAVVGGVAAAALVVWAAAAGTAAAGRALERLGDEMVRLADAQDDAAIRARLWQVSAGAVVHTNQELRLLAARAAKVGIQPELPPFLDLSGCALADSRELVTRAQDALATARLEVVRAEARCAKQALLTKLATTADDSPPTADLIAEYKEAQAHRWATLASGNQLPVPPPQPADESRVHAEIDKILLRLDPDATTDEREHVLTAAARAERKATNAATGHTYLEALGRVVNTVVNPKVARRREAAGLLAGLTHPVLTAMIGELPSPRPPFLGVVDRLDAVVRGEADLSDDDRRDAQAALAWAQAELDRAQQEEDRRRLQDGLVEAFAGLGYSVSPGLQVHHPGALSVTRRSWRGEYTADVWVDEAGNVKSRLVQVAAHAVGEATRCAELNADLRRVGAELVQGEIAASADLPLHFVPALKRINPDNLPGVPGEVVAPGYHPALDSTQEDR